MPSPVSGYVQVPTWTDALPDGCTCRWRNDGERGGWYLVTATPDCPAHYVPADDRQPGPDPRPWWEVEAERDGADCPESKMDDGRHTDNFYWDDGGPLRLVRKGPDRMSELMDGVTAFLQARLDEDEAEIGPSLSTTYCCDEENGVHLTRDRALREIAAGRELIKRYERAVAVGGTSPVSFVRGQDDGYRQACLDAISDRAAVYSDHPDYRQEWKP